MPESYISHGKAPRETVDYRSIDRFTRGNEQEEVLCLSSAYGFSLTTVSCVLPALPFFFFFGFPRLSPPYSYRHHDGQRHERGRIPRLTARVNGGASGADSEEVRLSHKISRQRRYVTVPSYLCRVTIDLPQRALGFSNRILLFCIGYTFEEQKKLRQFMCK